MCVWCVYGVVGVVCVCVCVCVCVREKRRVLNAQTAVRIITTVERSKIKQAAFACCSSYSQPRQTHLVSKLEQFVRCLYVALRYKIR